jgi:hypothetical protein
MEDPAKRMDFTEFCLGATGEAATLSLLADVGAGGRLPEGLSVPTGAGKTSAAMLRWPGLRFHDSTPVQFYCRMIEKRAEVLKRAIEAVSDKQLDTLEARLFEPAAAGSE